MINKAISRAIAVLEYMAGRKDGAGISEISRQLSIPKSSMSDILYTLFYLDYIQYDDIKLKTFKLGVKIY